MKKMLNMTTLRGTALKDWMPSMGLPVEKLGRGEKA